MGQSNYVKCAAHFLPNIVCLPNNVCDLPFFESKSNICILILQYRILQMLKIGWIRMLRIFVFNMEENTRYRFASKIIIGNIFEKQT